jgi:hypothetical protein
MFHISQGTAPATFKVNHETALIQAKKSYTRVQFSTAVQRAVFLVVTPYSLAEIYEISGENTASIFKIEASSPIP